MAKQKVKGYVARNYGTFWHTDIKWIECEIISVKKKEDYNKKEYLSYLVRVDNEEIFESPNVYIADDRKDIYEKVYDKE